MAKSKCNDQTNQILTWSISILFTGKLNKDRAEYRTRLNAAADCVHFLLRQELAFRGHDESYLAPKMVNKKTCGLSLGLYAC